MPTYYPWPGGFFHHGFPLLSQSLAAAIDIPYTVKYSSQSPMFSFGAVLLLSTVWLTGLCWDVSRARNIVVARSHRTCRSLGIGSLIIPVLFWSPNFGHQNPACTAPSLPRSKAVSGNTIWPKPQVCASSRAAAAVSPPGQCARVYGWFQHSTDRLSPLCGRFRLHVIYGLSNIPIEGPRARLCVGGGCVGARDG